MSEYVVCWDNDGIIGTWEHTRDELLNINHDETYGHPDGIRHGLTDVVQELQRRGIQSVVTTSAPRDEADVILEIGGIRPLFHEIFNGYELNFRTGGKNYLIVGTSQGWEKDELPHRMVIIGDEPRKDIPGDVTSTVFIFDGNETNAGEMLDAAVFQKVILGLLEAGDGSFINGYERLFDSSAQRDQGWDETGYRDIRQVDFDGVICNLFYTDREFQRSQRDPSHEGLTPVIEIINDPALLRPLDPLPLRRNVE